MLMWTEFPKYYKINSASTSVLGAVSFGVLASQPGTKSRSPVFHSSWAPIWSMRRCIKRRVMVVEILLLNPIYHFFGKVLDFYNIFGSSLNSSTLSFSIMIFYLLTYMGLVTLVCSTIAAESKKRQSANSTPGIFSWQADPGLMSMSFGVG